VADTTAGSKSAMNRSKRFKIPAAEATVEGRSDTEICSK
jgi:hypothetical protein